MNTHLLSRHPHVSCNEYMYLMKVMHSAGGIGGAHMKDEKQEQMATWNLKSSFETYTFE